MPRRQNAPDDPGPDDASPLDFCGWCFDWIPREAEHFSHAVDRSIADPGESPFFEGRIDDHLVFGIVPQPGCNPEFAGAGAVVVLCSDDCRTDLLMAVARQQARARGELVPPRLPTPAAGERAADILKGHCAWCRAPIADAAPVETVSALIHNLDREAGVIGIDIGDRTVHALALPLGFPLEHPDHNALFVTCSRACARALATAVHEHVASRRFH